jgi:hypothetical protein
MAYMGPMACPQDDERQRHTDRVGAALTTEFAEMSPAGEDEPIELADLESSSPADAGKRHELTGGAGVIHYAAQDGHLDVLEALLRDGADANAATKLKGWCPLHFAAYKGRLDVAELLVRHDASVHLPSSSGLSPLHLALHGHHWGVAQLLVAHACEQARKNPRWVRSHEYGRCCMRCTTIFGLFCSKHHCRYCGSAVCASCSSGRLPLGRWLAHSKPHSVQRTPSVEPLRVCDGCLAAVPELKPTVEVGLPGDAAQLLWLADGAPAPHTKLCKRCNHNTQTVVLRNPSPTRTVAFRFVAARLAHLYGVMPRQGWIDPDSSVQIEICLRDKPRQSEAGGSGRSAKGKTKDEEVMAATSRRQSQDQTKTQSQKQQYPQQPDRFILEAAWKDQAAWKDPAVHNDGLGPRAWWQAAADKAIIGGDELFECELVSEVVAVDESDVAEKLKSTMDAAASKGGNLDLSMMPPPQVAYGEL